MNRPSGLKYKLHKKNPTWFKKGFTPWNKDLRGKMIAWNKGLTKENDIRVAQYGKTLEKINKGKKFPIDYTNIKYRKAISDRMKGDKNPSKREEVRKKIRETLLKTYREHPEILENRKPAGINQYSNCFTSIEEVIAKELNLRNIPFVHNWKTGRYFPDFIIFENVIIECDGKHWHEDKLKEQQRDNYLYKLGYFVFHLKGTRITKNPRECINMVEMVMKGLHETNRFYMQGTSI